MPDKVELSMEGHREMKRLFNQLPYKIGDKVIKAAIRAAALPIVNGMKSRAPKEFGLLARSIGVRVKGYPRNGSAAAVVGAKSSVKEFRGVRTRGDKKGSSWFARPSKYAHLVEYGTEKGVRATRFMERGAKAGAPSSHFRFIRFLKRGIERECRKAGIKGSL